MKGSLSVDPEGGLLAIANRNSKVENRFARVAKLADAPDLGSGGEILRGSSPLPGRCRSCRQSKHAPFQFARIAFGFPQTYSAEKCIFISPVLDSLWQATETVHQAAAEYDVIGDERFL